MDFTHLTRECFDYKMSLNNFLNIGVCQLRMDFDSFVLNTPPNTATTSYGTCGDKFTVSRPTGGRSRFTALCGTNTGQHSN